MHVIRGRGLPEPVEGTLDQPLLLGLIPVVGPPIRYLAYQAGPFRFGWTLDPLRYLVSRHFFPRHYAFTLRLLPDGTWVVAQLKPFEHEDEARRWAGSLWRDAQRGRAAAQAAPQYPSDRGRDRVGPR